MKKEALIAVVAFGACAASAIGNPFGRNALVFSPTDDPAKIDATVERIFREQHRRQFGPDRYALLFMPGDYSKLKTVNVGYYTQVLGLGRTPDETRLPNVKTPAALPNNNATCNFWVGIENVTITEKENSEDPEFSFQWAVSQAAPARRLLVERKASFDWFYGWASGGYVADSVFRKPAGSYSQQQYYSRNCRFEGGFYGINWNNFLQGCEGRISDSKDNTGRSYSSSAPLNGAKGVSNWSAGGATTLVDATDAIREKPFLFVDDGRWKVFAPALRRNAKGVSWKPGEIGEGRVLDLAKDFFVAQAGRDDAKAINAALAKGRHVVFAPGVFHLSEPLRVVKPGTILLGIGEATLVPENPDEALHVDDVDGVTVAGLVFDAERESKRFLSVGRLSGKAPPRHRENPTILQDVVFRVGGTGRPGKVEQALVIHSSDVIVDQTWVWRADHGAHTGWKANTAKNGVVVDGHGVTAYGLFVEHFQEHDVLWTGEDGRVYFLQNEKCYDPPGNGDWMSHGGRKKGWAAYKVADHVKSHHAVGLGIYDVFINTDGNSVFLDDAIEVPDAAGVAIENACIVEIAHADGPKVGINHIVNGRGHGIRNGHDSGGGYAIQRLVRYSNGEADVLPDYYATH